MTTLTTSWVLNLLTSKCQRGTYKINWLYQRGLSKLFMHTFIEEFLCHTTRHPLYCSDGTLHWVLVLFCAKCQHLVLCTACSGPFPSHHTDPYPSGWRAGFLSHSDYRSAFAPFKASCEKVRRGAVIDINEIAHPRHEVVTTSRAFGMSLVLEIPFESFGLNLRQNTDSTLVAGWRRQKWTFPNPNRPRHSNDRPKCMPRIWEFSQ